MTASTDQQEATANTDNVVISKILGGVYTPIQMHQFSPLDQQKQSNAQNDSATQVALDWTEEESLDEVALLQEAQKAQQSVMSDLQSDSNRPPVVQKLILSPAKPTITSTEDEHLLFNLYHTINHQHNHHANSFPTKALTTQQSPSQDAQSHQTIKATVSPGTQ
jgi:hypothetical protein